MNIQAAIEAAQVAQHTIPGCDFVIERPMNDWIEDDERNAEFMFEIFNRTAILTGATTQEFTSNPRDYHTREEVIAMIGAEYVSKLEDQAEEEA